APAQLAPYGWWLYRLHQELIALRRRNPWLTRGDLSVLDKTNTCLTYQVAGAGHRLEARLDLDQQRVEVRIDQERVFAFPGA
ncbi:MAG: alpha-amylase, partial [Actinomycetia bacterium]|nr:alpha-amylase [Actinomycetes bacterium]